MTHIGYVKPQMFKHPRGPYTITKRPVKDIYHPLAGFSQLQGLHNRSPGGTPDASRSFFPLSVITDTRDSVKFHFYALPAPRFSQPLSECMTNSRIVGLFHPTTLQGFPSSELYSTPIADFHQVTPASSPSTVIHGLLSSRGEPLPSGSDRYGTTRIEPTAEQPLTSFEIGFRLELSSVLKLQSRSGAHPSHYSFTRNTRLQLS
jgi:hypothetical protein